MCIYIYICTHTYTHTYTYINIYTYSECPGAGSISRDVVSFLTELCRRRSGKGGVRQVSIYIYIYIYTRIYYILRYRPYLRDRSSKVMGWFSEVASLVPPDERRGAGARGVLRKSISNINVSWFWVVAIYSW